jgi:hypothetical protein
MGSIYRPHGHSSDPPSSAARPCRPSADFYENADHRRAVIARYAVRMGGMIGGSWLLGCPAASDRPAGAGLCTAPPAAPHAARQLLSDTQSRLAKPEEAVEAGVVGRRQWSPPCRFRLV